MTQSSRHCTDWRLRAQAVLADSPAPVAGSRRVAFPFAILLSGLSFFAGIALTGTASFGHPQASAALVRSVVPDVPAAPLHMSYRLAAAPQAIAAADTKRAGE